MFEICDIEVFDGVSSQYFSVLNSLDILIQPPCESDSFPDFRCAPAKVVENAEGGQMPKSKNVTSRHCISLAMRRPRIYL